MGIASRTKWQRRINTGKRVRKGRALTKTYAETIRKQEKLRATVSPYDLNGLAEMPGE